jgi:hypothetical protein
MRESEFLILVIISALSNIAKFQEQYIPAKGMSQNVSWIFSQITKFVGGLEIVFPNFLMRMIRSDVKQCI